MSLPILPVRAAVAESADPPGEVKPGQPTELHVQAQLLKFRWSKIHLSKPLHQAHSAKLADASPDEASDASSLTEVHFCFCGRKLPSALVVKCHCHKTGLVAEDADLVDAESAEDEEGALVATASGN